MIKCFAFSLIFLAFEICFSMSEESFFSIIRNSVEINVRQNSSLKGMASVKVGNSDYADHLAVIFETENSINTTGSKTIVFFDYDENAFAHKFEIKDVDNDNEDELLVWFMLGNHGHYLKIYELPARGDFAKPVPWQQTFVGDSWDCEIKDGYINCYTFNTDTKQKETYARYKIQKNSAILVNKNSGSYYIIAGFGFIFAVCFFVLIWRKGKHLRLKMCGSQNFF